MKSWCFAPNPSLHDLYCYLWIYFYFNLLDQMLALHFDFKQLSYFPDQGQFPESESGMDGAQMEPMKYLSSEMLCSAQRGLETSRAAKTLP